MADDGRAQELRERFTQEQDYIGRYVALLQRRTVSRQELSDLIRLLEKYGLLNTDEKKRWPLSKQAFSTSNLQEMNTRIQQVKPMVLDLLQKVEGELRRVNELPDLKEIFGALENDVSLESIDDIGLRKKLEEQIKGYNDLEAYRSSETIGKLLGIAIVGVIHWIEARKYADLQRSISTIDDMDISSKMFGDKSDINVLRQAFITLMALFDASMFDIVKLAITRDFTLINLFGKSEKLSVEEISKFKSFDNLKDSIIEKALKEKYLKEILFNLNAQKIALIGEEDEFGHLIEMVLRRNVHLHNRGIVDNKYLEPNASGAPQYNIYNLSLGSVASIDAQYWERANRLCQNCINATAEWVDSLT